MGIVALVPATIVGIGVLLLFIGVGRLIEPQTSLKDRLDALSPLSALLTPDGVPVQEPGSEDWSSDKTAHPVTQWVNRVISGRSFAASVATELARANLPLTVSEYLALNIASVLICSLLALLVLRQISFALLGAPLGLVLPRAYVRRRQEKRLIAFQDQLPDVLTMLVGSLRSGYGITIAMDTVAKQMPSPASEEFSRVVREIGLGVPTTHALSNLVRRVRSDDLDLVVTAINIQYEVGGNLAEILETISSTIRERVRLKGQLRALTAQQALQRTILTALPLVLALIIYLLNPAYMRALLLPGPWLLIPGTAAVLAVMGYFVMGKLSHIEL